jgi:hypothetical protein
VWQWAGRCVVVGWKVCSSGPEGVWFVGWKVCGIGLEGVQ